MSIVTLTSDYGTKGYYVAFLKGVIYRQCGSDVCIVDVTHDIAAYNLIEAAFICQNISQIYPKGTIHVFAVDSACVWNSALLLMYCYNQYFIAPDNGLLSLAFGQQDFIISKVAQTGKDSFEHLSAHIINELQKGKTIHQIGTITQEYKKQSTFQPTVHQNMIKGMVIYIDAYENLILNVRQDLFLEVQNGRKVELICKTNTVSGLVDNYSQVPEGEIFCLFNQLGYLTIGINKGKASSLLGITYNQTILIQFT